MWPPHTHLHVRPRIDLLVNFVKHNGEVLVPLWHVGLDSRVEPLPKLLQQQLQCTNISD